jgi:septal ring factor EnvC (AmiA/AmiB activator)
MRRFAFTTLAVLAMAAPAAAQDVRGMEVCTAEKTMERRTSCLQSNVEFLQRTLTKNTRETADRLTAASREIAAQRSDIAALKATLAKLEQELAESKKAKPEKK